MHENGTRLHSDTVGNCLHICHQHILCSSFIAPGDLKMWRLSVLLRVWDGIRLQVEDKSFSFYRCFIQPKIFFMEMPDWQQTIKHHSSVIFKAMLIWGVELFGGYRTVVFVHEVLALHIYLLLSVRAHNNKRRMSLKREPAGFCLLIFSSPHTDRGRERFLPLISGLH